MERKVFKRSKVGLVLSIVGWPFAAFAAYVIASFFTVNSIILLIIAGIVALLYFFIVILGENENFAIENGKLYYYKGKKLKKEFIIDNIVVGYSMKVSGRDNSLSSATLEILDKTTGENDQIDGTGIGRNRFHEMFKILQDMTEKVENFDQVEELDEIEELEEVQVAE